MRGLLVRECACVQTATAEGADSLPFEMHTERRQVSTSTTGIKKSPAGSDYHIYAISG